MQNVITESTINSLVSTNEFDFSEKSDYEVFTEAEEIFNNGIITPVTQGKIFDYIKNEL